MLKKAKHQVRTLFKKPDSPLDGPNPYREAVKTGREVLKLTIKTAESLDFIGPLKSALGVIDLLVEGFDVSCLPT